MVQRALRLHKEQSIFIKCYTVDNRSLMEDVQKPQKIGRIVNKQIELDRNKEEENAREIIKVTESFVGILNIQYSGLIEMLFQSLMKFKQ